MRLASLLLLLAASSCSCAGSGVIVADAFAPRAGGAALEESLHPYASFAQVALLVRGATELVDAEQLSVIVDGAAALDDEVEVVRDDGALSFALKTRAAGEAELRFVDNDGGDIDARTLVVADVARFDLDVTTPAIPGIELPVVDPAALRIAKGGRAALRTTLFDADDDELFGTAAVAGEPADDAFGIRQTAGCAPSTCLAQRSAVEVSVPADAGDGPVEVLLTAGAASRTVSVLPTDVAAIDGLAGAAQDADGLAAADRFVVYARPSVAGDVVFGAPVAWTLDDAAIEGAGDVAALTFAPGATKTLTATLGALTTSVDVATDDAPADVSITSVTAACASLTGDQAALAALALAALAGARRGRRRRPLR